MKNNLQLGTKLFTKDGRKFGNALITDVNATQFVVTGENGYEAGFTTQAIKSLFHIQGKPTDADIVTEKLKETWENKNIVSN